MSKTGNYNICLLSTNSSILALQALWWGGTLRLTVLIRLLVNNNSPKIYPLKVSASNTPPTCNLKPASLWIHFWHRTEARDFFYWLLKEAKLLMLWSEIWQMASRYGTLKHSNVNIWEYPFAKLESLWPIDMWEWIALDHFHFDGQSLFSKMYVSPASHPP